MTTRPCARRWPRGSAGNPTWKSAAKPPTCNEALRLVADTQPDVAIVDISLKTGSGIDLIKRIKDRNDSVRMLVWSMHSESLYAERARCGPGRWVTSTKIKPPTRSSKPSGGCWKAKCT